jgi:integrase
VHQGRRCLASRRSDGDTVAVYIASLATDGKSPSTIMQRLAAIKARHEAAGQPSPTESQQARAVLDGIRRSSNWRIRRKRPATVDVIAAMVAQCPDSLLGLRDRALLLFGSASALRRSDWPRSWSMI